MAFNWFKKKDPLAGAEGPKGSRLSRPHSPSGWTDKRVEAAEKPASQRKVKDSDISGYHVTGRKRKGDQK